MPTGGTFVTAAASGSTVRKLALAGAAGLVLAGCALVERRQTTAPGSAQATGPAAASSAAATPAAPAQTAVAATPPAPPPPPPLPFDEAIRSAADALFSKADLPAGPARPVVIDPLVDGATGTQSTATQTMGTIIADVARQRYVQRFAVQDFSADAVASAPLVLVGTFTGLNKEGKPIGQREVFRVCLALADLKTGKIVGKGTARAKPDGVAPVPLAYFQDSPAWRLDEGVDGYIKTCQGTKAGDPINPAYLDGILASALAGEGIEAYNAGRYREALELYQSALATPAGDQLRVHNGLYLANRKLGREDEAAQAFGRLVDHGLSKNRLVVKLLFKQGSTAFWPDPAVSEPYPMWLGQIAQGAARKGSCLEVSGHTSPTGPAALNERLSLLRAEYVRSRLEADAPALVGRTIANGVGSRETIIGTGRDDVTDALDRRVEFKPIAC